MRRLVKRSKIMYMHPFYNTTTTLICSNIERDRLATGPTVASNVNGFRQVNNDDIKSTTNVVKSIVTDVPLQPHLANSSSIPRSNHLPFFTPMSCFNSRVAGIFGHAVK